MKNNQGNIIILFAIIILGLGLIFLFTLKNKIQKGWNSSDHKTQPVEQVESKTEPTNFSSATVLEPSKAAPKPNAVNQYEYYNDVRVIQNNETLNPFITSPNPNPLPNPAQNGKSKTLAGNQKSHINVNPNLLKVAPNGFTFPQATGYLIGYPIKNKHGKLNITISNTVGHSNLAVFVYLKKHYNDSRNIDLNELTSASYIRAGDTFKFSNVQSGYYRIVWINLANKQAFKSKDFAVFQDNKYAYDRVFTFYPNNKLAQGKATHVPLALIYNHQP
ncbi:hypothetical protein [Acinetobacter indicus]|uniref:hypothetical protein n=1 Tax=Acinetobacter indicus TaxID=756892 RepID=UPI003989EC7E